MEKQDLMCGDGAFASDRFKNNIVDNECVKHFHFSKIWNFLICGKSINT